MKISPYINLLLASTAVLSSCTTKQTVEKTRPNILYIMCDDHSYGLSVLMAVRCPNWLLHRTLTVLPVKECCSIVLL